MVDHHDSFTKDRKNSKTGSAMVGRRDGRSPRLHLGPQHSVPGPPEIEGVMVDRHDCGSSLTDCSKLKA
jgi:hypothetical protein